MLWSPAYLRSVTLSVTVFIFPTCNILVRLTTTPKEPGIKPRSSPLQLIRLGCVVRIYNTDSIDVFDHDGLANDRILLVVFHFPDFLDDMICHFLFQKLHSMLKLVASTMKFLELFQSYLKAFVEISTGTTFKRLSMIAPQKQRK